MSNRNNVVFNVLPTSNNAGVLAKDNTLDALPVGRLAFVNAKTQQTFDATSDVPKEFLIALGKGENGTLTDFRFSAGQAIQTKNIVGFTEKAYNAGSPMKVVVATTSAKADTEYGIRIEFRNSRIYRFQGYNQFSKAFMVKTPCADLCVDECGNYDVTALMQLLKNEINQDAQGLVSASLITPVDLVTEASTPANPDEVVIAGLSTNYDIGDVVSADDIAVIIAFNASGTPKVNLQLELTSQPIKIGEWCQVNLAYHKLLETVLIVSPVEGGFSCPGVTVTNTYPVFAEGTGANIMQKEYHAGGWNGAGPYVLSEVTGTPKGNIEYLANKATNYTQFILEYNVKSEGGWLEYENPLTTVIAIPSTHTNTINSVRAMLQKVTA